MEDETVIIERDVEHAVVNIYVGDCLHRVSFQMATCIGRDADLVEWAMVEHDDECIAEE